MKKRAISVFLALCVILTVLPAHVFASEVTSGRFQKTNLVEWEFKDGTLYITCDEGAIYEEPWAHLKDRIESLVFKGSLLSIFSSFSDYPVLKSITWPSNISYLGDSAFSDCPLLESVTLPDTIKTISRDAFSRCYSLSYVELPSNLETLYGAFTTTPFLESVSLPYGLKKISGAFSYSGLTDLLIPSTVTSVGQNTLLNCSDLRSVRFLGSAPSIHRDAFKNTRATIYYDSGNSSWKDTIAELQGSGLTWKGVSNPETVSLFQHTQYTFKNGVLTLSGTGKITRTPWQQASYLVEEVIIEDGITVIPYAAFSRCENLKKITIPNSVTVIDGNVFSQCVGLTEISLPDSIETIGDSAFFRCTSLERVKLPSGLTVIGAYLFYENTALQTLTLPSGISQIQNAAFYKSGLTSITIPASVKNLKDYAFAYCDSLENIVFEGNAPKFDGEYIFQSTTTSAFYPPNNTTWTERVMKNYQGTVYWHKEHEHTFIPTVTEPSCYEQGFTTHTCSVCEYSFTDSYTDPLGHTYKDWVYAADRHEHTTACIRCDHTVTQTCVYDDVSVIQAASSTQQGEAVHTCITCSGTYSGQYDYRIYGDNRYETAFKIADTLKEQLGVEKFDCVIIADGNNYADALSGSYLAYVKKAPILLTNSKNAEKVKEYINNNLVYNGIVYLLGGWKAVPTYMETGYQHARVRRLGGMNRYETSLIILDEIGVSDQDIIICTGAGFADSLSASAAKLPILLVSKELTDWHKRVLSNNTGKKYIIGGTEAVSEKLEKTIQAYGTTERIGGTTRYDTSLLVAKKFAKDPDMIILAYALNFPDGLCGGPLAASLNAPLILTLSGKESGPAQYVKEHSVMSGCVLGGPRLIPDKSAKMIFSATTD